MKNHFEKSTLIVLSVIALLAINITVFAEGRWIEAYQDGTFGIKFNGIVQTFTDPDDGSKIAPILYNDRSYLPVRAISTLVGLNVDYDEATNTALLTNGGTPSNTNTNQPNSNTEGKWVDAYQDDTFKIKYNGVLQSFTDPDDGSKIVPILYNDRAYLPVRAISTLVGLNVNYDEATNTALLSNSSYVPPVTNPNSNTNQPSGNSNGAKMLEDFNKVNIGDTYEQVVNKIGEGKLTYQSNILKDYIWVYNEEPEAGIVIYVDTETNTVFSKRMDYMEFLDTFKDSKVDISAAKELSSQTEEEAGEGNGTVTYDKLVESFGTSGIPISVNYNNIVEEYMWVDSNCNHAYAIINEDGQTVYALHSNIDD